MACILLMKLVMEDLLINLAFVGGQAGADKGSSTGEGTQETGSEDFLGILKHLMYGKNTQAKATDEMDGPADTVGSESEGVMGLPAAPVDRRLTDAAPFAPDGSGDQGAIPTQDGGMEVSDLTVSDSATPHAAPDRASTAPHASGQAKDQPESMTMNGDDPAALFSQVPLNSVMALLADQASSGKEPDKEIEVMQGQSRAPLSRDDLVRQSMEKNAEAARIPAEQGGQAENRDETTGEGTGNETKTGDPEQPLDVLMENAAKKYGAFMEDKDRIRGKADAEPSDGLLKSSGRDIPQGDSLKTATPHAAPDRASTAPHASGQAKDQPESMTMNGDDPAALFSQVPLNSVMALLADQASSGKEPDKEIEVMQGQSRAPLSRDDLVRQSMEKNAEAARIPAEQGGQAENRDETTGEGTGKNKGHGDTALRDHGALRKMTDSTFIYNIEGNETKTGDPEQPLDVLMENAAKKYGAFMEDKDRIRGKADAEPSDGLLKSSGRDIPQGDSLKTDVLQAKGDARVFEKGSFSSFIADRVEKVVEQYASRNSSMDTVVRLKLDDKETLTVGLKHEGRNVVVEVKASNEGLANLLQSHKEDITRNLEDKNVFARIYVEADGENGSERQNQRGSKREDGRKEEKASFTTILEAIA